jgi:hypothetical protein
MGDIMYTNYCNIALNAGLIVYQFGIPLFPEFFVPDAKFNPEMGLQWWYDAQSSITCKKPEIVIRLKLFQ